MAEVLALLCGVGGLVFLVGITYLMYDFTKGQRKTNQYISLYKIGRIKQMAKDKGIDLLEVAKEDKAFFTTDRTMKDAIESKLMDDMSLNDVETMRPKTQTTTKKTYNKKKKK